MSNAENIHIEVNQPMFPYTEEQQHFRRELGNHFRVCQVLFYQRFADVFGLVTNLCGSTGLDGRVEAIAFVEDEDFSKTEAVGMIVSREHWPPDQLTLLEEFCRTANIRIFIYGTDGTVTEGMNPGNYELGWARIVLHLRREAKAAERGGRLEDDDN